MRNILQQEVLISEYLVNNKSVYQIAQELGCSPATVYRYLKKYNLQQNRNSVDITNKKSNMLTAIKPLRKRKNNSTIWLCLCECGNETEVDVAHFNAGSVKSCGCLLKRKRA
jgi:predicted transcriptional regulator